MKPASLALAAALAASLGCVQPASAQTQDETGAPQAERAVPMRPMAPHRRMMMMGGGAQFHFVRGKARVDVTCSAQEDTEACVRAAGALIDKIAKLRDAGRDDTTTGSADRGEDRGNGAAPDDDDQGALGERM